MPFTWLCLSIYVVPACILYPATMYWTVSGIFLHSLHLDSCFTEIDLCFDGSDHINYSGTSKQCIKIIYNLLKILKL